MTTYFDEAVTNGVRFNPDLGQLGNTLISACTVHSPDHKALSPRPDQNYWMRTA